MSYLTQGAEFPHTNSAKDISIRQHERAAERGHVCKYPAPNELFLDIDSLEGLGRMHAAFTQNSYMKSIVASVHTHASPSGKAGRFHVIVTLSKNVSKFERITLQALLGSDLAREILSYQEAQAGCHNPTVFFEKAPARLKEPPAFAPAVPSPDDDLPARPRGYDMGACY